MLYKMLTGTRPQGAFDLPSISSRVDVRLDEVVIKAMRQEPERRFQRISELREVVDRVRHRPSQQRCLAIPFQYRHLWSLDHRTKRAPHLTRSCGQSSCCSSASAGGVCAFQASRPPGLLA